MKSKIEWLKSADGKLGYTINPVKGLCPVACPYCYARRMYKRFHWDETPRVWLGVFDELKKIKTPSRIFVGSTFELFHDVCTEVLPWIFGEVRKFPQHTFIFLTKRPENLIKWSPFPANCWAGLSADGTENAPTRRIYNGLDRTQATVKFISFEPLLAETKLDYRDLVDCGINWVIIGQQTPVKASTSPKIEWVKEIVEAADKAKIPVFLKDNLIPMIDDLPNNCFTKTEFGEMNLRQGFPKVEIPK